MRVTPIQRGEIVRLSIGTWSTEAFVAAASPNGRSLFVIFDGAAPVGGGAGVLVGSLALLQDDAGAWHEIVLDTPVVVEPVPRSFLCPRCGAVSYNQTDVAERYCGRCHAFVDDAELPRS
jgi:ribosomal protein S27AE